MLRAIIFDMDGVLVDSEPVHFKANQIVMQKHFGIELNYDEDKKFIGSTVEHIWKSYKERYNIEGYEWNELMDMGEKELENIIEKDGYPIIDGAKEFVFSLKNISEKGYKLAIASSSPMKKILRNIKTIGIEDCFDVLVSGMEVGKPKPNPDIFLEAANKLGVEPNECIVIEDSCNGTRAAKAAGMACLGFINKNSGDQDLSVADYLFESFRNIDEGFIRMVHNHCFKEPFEVIKTKRLIIREMSTSDVDRLYELYNDEEVTKYMENLFEKKEDEIEYTQNYIDKVYGFYGYGTWVITLQDNTIIGRAGVEFKESEGQILGYMLGKKYWGNGYAFEACSAILEYVKREFDIEKVNTKVHIDNIRSIVLANKLGFVFNYDEVDGEGYIFGTR